MKRHLLALLLIVTTAAHAAIVTRGPYLQNATPGSIVIRWRTDVATPGRVRFGTDGNALTLSASDPALTTEHEIPIAGLPPDTTYFYAIGDGATDLAGPSSEHRFRTLPVAGTVQPVRVWVLGDSGTGGDGSGRAESVLQAYLNSPQFKYNDVWLMLGDNAYGAGSDDEYQRAVFQTYARLLPNTRLWSTIGNHETNQVANPDISTVPYFSIFTLPRAGEAGGVASGTERYYSFDYANIHFVCLDSMTSVRTAGSPMLAWLAADLDATAQKWIVAFWHHPPYTHGTHNSDTETELKEMRENVLPILEAHNVDLVLSGHSHGYERTFLLDGHYGDSSTLVASMIKDGGSGNPPAAPPATAGAYMKTVAAHSGSVYVVAGHGGQTPFIGSTHPAMFTQIAVLGSLVLDVNGARLDAKMIDNTGAVRDFFTIVKPDVSPEIFRGQYSQLLTGANGVAGRIQLTLGGGGAFTGRLQFGGSDSVLIGTFGADGVFHGTASGLALTLTLRLASAVPHLIGEVTSGATTWTSDSAVVGTDALADFGKKGRYTFIVPDSLQAGIPRGDAWAVFAGDLHGSLRITGRFADGAKFSGDGMMQADGSVPLYLQRTDPPAESLGGTLRFSDARGTSFTGDLLWNRFADANSAGFTATSSIVGGRFIPPATGRPIFTFPNPAAKILKAKLTADAPGFPLKAIFTARADRLEAAPPNANGFALQFTAATGQFGGGFDHPTLGRCKVSGVFLQQANVVRGNFAGGGVSGSLRLAPRQ